MTAYAVDTYTVAHGHGLQDPATVRLPDRNGQLAALDHFADQQRTAGHAVRWVATGVVVARRHNGELRAVAIARTLADQPEPIAPDLARQLAGQPNY